MRSRLFILAAVLSFAGCHENDVPEVRYGYGEQLIYADESVAYYLCDHEWGGIVLSVTNPSGVQVAPWHIPTTDDLYAIRFASVTNGKYRYLCYDEEQDLYYTFKFNGEGTVSKAGMKTAYAIRPIRKIMQPKDTIIRL